MKNQIDSNCLKKKNLFDLISFIFALFLSPPSISPPFYISNTFILSFPPFLHHSLSSLFLSHLQHLSPHFVAVTFLRCRWRPVSSPASGSAAAAAITALAPIPFTRAPRRRIWRRRRWSAAVRCSSSCSRRRVARRRRRRSSWCRGWAEAIFSWRCRWWFWPFTSIIGITWAGRTLTVRASGPSGRNPTSSRLGLILCSLLRSWFKARTIALEMTRLPSSPPSPTHRDSLRLPSRLAFPLLSVLPLAIFCG